MTVRIIIAISFIHTATLAQTVTLPTWLADSAIYEIKIGRQCNEVMKAQQNEIESLGRELVANGKALTLSQTSNSTLSALLNNAKNGQEILSMQFAKDLKEEKKKTKRWRRIGIIETVGLIGLLILML